MPAAGPADTAAHPPALDPALPVEPGDAPGGLPSASPAPDAPAARHSACGAAALAFGIAGVVLSGIPAVGRYLALALGVLAVALGVVGMRRATYGTKGTGHRLAVAGLTLGIVALFEGATSMLTCFVLSSVLLGG